MSKKFVYFFSALTMLALAIALAFTLSKPMPEMLASNITSPDANIKSQPLEQVQNIMGEVSLNIPENKQDNAPLPTTNTHDLPDFREPKSEPKAEEILQKNEPTVQNFPEINSMADAQAQEQDDLGKTENKVTSSSPSTSNQPKETIPASNNNAPAQEQKPAQPANKVEEPKAKVSEPTKEPTEPAEKPKEAESKPEQVSTAKIIAETDLSPKGNAPTVIHSQIIEDGENIVFRVEGNQAIDGKSFNLASPDRIVFDIRGAWAITPPKISNHTVIRGIRSGKTETHTRLVLDLLKKPKSSKLVQVDEKTLELVFN